MCTRVLCVCCVSRRTKGMNRSTQRNLRSFASSEELSRGSHVLLLLFRCLVDLTLALS